MARVVGKSAQYWSSFSPSNIPGLTLWYDFSDTSTIDLSGEYQVTRVRDKSGKGAHGTPSNPAGSYWIYDGVNSSVMRTPVTASNNLALDICLNASTLYFSGAVVMSGVGSQIVYVFGGKEPGCAFFRTQASGGYAAGQTNNVLASPTNANDNTAMSVGSFSGGGNLRIAANGVVSGGVGSYLNQPQVRDGIPMIIGSYNLTTIRNQGSMYELLLFSNILTDSDRAAVEEYLIKKWMTTPNSPPTITRPTDISGCNLWLDTSGGASNFTFAAGTSNIVRWTDKSSNSYDVSTSGTSYPIWQDVSGYVYFSGGVSLMGTARPEPSRATETGFLVGIRGSAVLRTIINGNASGSGLGPARQINSGGTTPYNVRVINATPAITQFNPVEIIGNTSGLTSAAHEFCWRIKGKEFFARLGGQAGSYKAPADWVDISGTGTTSIGNADHYFREIILYDRALSTSEISNVSAYLTQKWGLSNYKTFTTPPPSNRAYNLTQSFSRPLQIPYDIANCTLWLDAKDTNTIQLDSSGNVLKWLDKSGWGNDISGGISRPSYSNQTVVFNSNSMTVRNSNTGSATNFRFNPPFSIRFHTLIALHKPASATGNTGLIDFGHTSSATCNVSFPTIDSSSATTPRGYVNSTTTTGTRNTSRFLENSLTSEYNIITASIQSNRYAIYRNGVIQQDVSAVVASSYNFSSSVITSIGRWGSNNSTFYQGEVKEIFIFDRALSTYSVAQIEAYLAKKWNLTSLLPSNHPALYASVPVTANVGVPALEGVALWVDAMTYMGEYSNNATITTNWSNRAYKPSAVVPTGTPKFLSNAWQGRPGIDMTSGSFTSTFGIDVSLTSYSHQTFIVASYNTGAPNTTRDAMFFRTAATTNPKHALLQVRPLDASLGTQFTNSAGTLTGGVFVAPPPVTAGTPFIFEVGQNTIFGGGWTVNGNTVSNTSSMSLTAGSYGWVGIGQDSGTNTTPTWNGTIHEILVYGPITPGDFDNQSRFRIRSYLARKWGLLNVLPTYPDKGIVV